MCSYFYRKWGTNKGNPREHNLVHLQRQNKAPAVCDVRLQLFCGQRDSPSGRASKAPTQISAVFQNPSEARADTKSGFDQNAGILHVLTPSPARNSRSLHFWPGNYPVLLTSRVSSSTLISPTHKRTEGRAPVWGSEFTSKRRRTTGGIQQKPQ